MSVHPHAGEITLVRRVGSALSAPELHDLLRLRVDVFVVEQECPYSEVDGLDLLESTEHVWFADLNGPAAYIRVLADPDGWRIGRVVTRPDRRGERLAGRLLDDILTRIEGSPSQLEAQSYLVDFYSSFGFTSSGPEYIEDGIPHIPMRREATHS